jgi:hypothetical protein
MFAPSLFGISVNSIDAGWVLSSPNQEKTSGLKLAMQPSTTIRSDMVRRSKWHKYPATEVFLYRIVILISDVCDDDDDDAESCRLSKVEYLHKCFTSLQQMSFL